MREYPSPPAGPPRSPTSASARFRRRSAGTWASPRRATCDRSAWPACTRTCAGPIRARARSAGSPTGRASATSAGSPLPTGRDSASTPPRRCATAENPDPVHHDVRPLRRELGRVRAVSRRRHVVASAGVARSPERGVMIRLPAATNNCPRTRNPEHATDDPSATRHPISPTSSADLACLRSRRRRALRGRIDRGSCTGRPPRSRLGILSQCPAL
jgi:hypothetical protein